MARPFPVSAPDGRVYAWACGRCHHLASMGERLIELSGPDESSIAHAKTSAERCCTCEKCGNEIGRVALFEPPVCTECRPAFDAEEAARRAAVAALHASYEEKRGESLKAALDGDAANLLEQAMSDISEDHWAAGWLSGLEHSLWPMVAGTDDTRHFGMGDVIEADITNLRRLHEKCGGWWRWEDGADGGALFVPTAEWVAIHKRHLAAVAATEGK